MVRKKTDALVVGAGPVGLSTALSLVHRGVEVEVVDQEWRKAGRSYALALHPAAMEVLAESGLGKELVERGYRVDRLGFYEGDRAVAAVEYGRLDSRWPFLLILPQNELEGVLEDALRARGVEVRWNHALASLTTEGDELRASVERREKTSTGYAAASTDWIIDRIFRLSARYVVGADGHRSRVRREFRIPFEDAGPAERFAVYEFDTDFDAKGEARVAFGPDGATAVYWPLPGGRGRIGFSLPEGEGGPGERTKSRLTVQIAGEGYPHLPPDGLARLVADRAPWFTGSLGAVHWSLVVRFERRLARDFAAGRALLAGDSVHLAGPVGVLSMNEGVLEGAEIAAGVQDVLANGLPESRLADAAAARQAKWRRLLAPGGGFRAGPDAPDAIRAREEEIIRLLPASGSHRATLAAGLGLVPRED